MDQKQIGAFIAQLRKEKQLSQAELGARIGVTNKTVSRWENGNYMPDISLLVPLCDELGVHVHELLSGQRLSDEHFRDRADANMVASLQSQRQLARRKVLTDFLEGGGTGLLASTLLTPDSWRKILIAAVAITMILVGWRRRKKQWDTLCGIASAE